MALATSGRHVVCTAARLARAAIALATTAPQRYRRRQIEPGGAAVGRSPSRRHRSSRGSIVCCALADGPVDAFEGYRWWWWWWCLAWKRCGRSKVLRTTQCALVAAAIAVYEVAAVQCATSAGAAAVARWQCSCRCAVSMAPLTVVAQTMLIVAIGAMLSPRPAAPLAVQIAVTTALARAPTAMLILASNAPDRTGESSGGCDAAQSSGGGDGDHDDAVDGGQRACRSLPR